MALIRGRVDQVQTTKNKFGDMVFFHIDGTRYFNGKFAGGVQEGDYVEFQAEQNEKGYWNVTRGTVKPIEAPKAAEAPKPTEAGGKVAGNTTLPSYNEVRQDRIEFQSARNAAIELVKTLISVNAIDFGKAKGAAKAEMVELWIDEYTEHFVTENKNRQTSPSQVIESDTVEEGSPESKPIQIGRAHV